MKRLSRDAIHRPIDYSQINPRILGNIYEQFLGYVIEIKQGRLDPQAGRDTRRKQGSFYTPESVTKYLVEQSVQQALALQPDRKPWELRCLDPACGSGHFLVEYVNHVARLCEEIDDSRSYPAWKRYVTEHCVFGVDKDRTAVMLTKLSLWINSAMKDEPFATIDTHVKCGNSLLFATPAGFRLADYDQHPDKNRKLASLRKDLAKLEEQADKGHSLLGKVEAVELHREVRRALARIEEAKPPIARQFTETLKRTLAQPFRRKPVSLGSGFRRGVRGPRRLRRRRRQSALGRRPLRDRRLSGRAARFNWPAANTTATSCSSNLAAACCTIAACSASSFPTASPCPSTSRCAACCWRTPRSRA